MDGNDTAIILGGVAAIIALIEIVKILVVRALNRKEHAPANPFACRYDRELHAQLITQLRDGQRTIIGELKEIEARLEGEGKETRKLMRDWMNRRN